MSDASLAHSFLGRYGITRAKVRAISRLDCDVYRVVPIEFDRRRMDLPPGDLVLRVHAAEKSDRADVEAEMQWLEALAGEGVLVPRPVADCEGQVLQAWQEAAEEPVRFAVVLSWVAGRMHDRGLNAVRLQRIGELTARLHRRSQAMARAGRIKSSRLAFSPDLDAWACARRPASTHCPASLADLVAKVAAELLVQLDGFPRNEDAHGFVHADLHPWNIVFAGSAAGAIDFSDCGWGHHALDLATTLQFLKHPLANNHDHRAQYPRLHDALLGGYARIRPLPADVEAQIDACIVARTIGTLEWILDDWPRPDHRAWGPGFLTRCEAIFVDYLDR